MKKRKIYKIELYQRTKGWDVIVMLYGSGETLTYCFSTTKQMLKFLSKKAI